MSSTRLERALAATLETARRREEHDDHLSTDERRALVEMYRLLHPQESLPTDLDDAFVQIIFD